MFVIDCVGIFWKKHTAAIFTSNINREDTDEPFLLSSLPTVVAEDGAKSDNGACLTESLLRNLSLRFVTIGDIDEERNEVFNFIKLDYPVVTLSENTNIANFGALTQF